MKKIIITYEFPSKIITLTEEEFLSAIQRDTSTLSVAIQRYLSLFNMNKEKVAILVVGRTVESVHKSAYYGKSLFPQEMIRELNKVYTGAQLAFEIDCVFNAEYSQYPDKWVEEEETRIRKKYGITQEEWRREEAYEQFCAELSF